MFEFFCNVNIKMKLFFFKANIYQENHKGYCNKKHWTFQKKNTGLCVQIWVIVVTCFFLTIISIQRAKRYFCSLSFDSTVKIFSGQSPKFFKVLFTSVDFILFFNFSFRKKKNFKIDYFSIFNQFNFDSSTSKFLLSKISPVLNETQHFYHYDFSVPSSFFSCYC